MSKHDAPTAALAAGGHAALPLSFIASLQSAISQTVRSRRAGVKPSVKLIPLQSDSPPYLTQVKWCDLWLSGFPQLTAISLVWPVRTVGVLVTHPEFGDAVHGGLALELVRRARAFGWRQRWITYTHNVHGTETNPSNYWYRYDKSQEKKM